MPHSMKQQLEVGAAGAARVKLLFARRFGLLIDYEGVRNKQKIGIDFHVEPWGNIEVKTDTHVTENFFLEYECSSKPSGIVMSQSDYWAYYFPKLGRIYMLPTLQLRQFIEKNIKWFVTKYKKTTQSRAGNSTWSANGLVVPRDYICGEIEVVIYEDYKDRLWLVAGREKEVEERVGAANTNKTAVTDDALSETT